MQRYYKALIDANGNPAAGVSCLVTDADTGAVVTLFSDYQDILDCTNAISNPVVSGSNGVIAFAARNGRYNLLFTGGGLANRTESWLTMIDGSGGWIATGTLAQFDPTTSAQLAGVISDETGSGALVFAESPTLVTPTLGDATIGNATATSINGTTIPTSKTLVVTTDKLSSLAATTSLELKGVISDETGSGALVFANTPTLVTPEIGAATATSINGTTIPSSKTLVVTTDKISALAATTSAEFAGVISDEVGTGKVILQTGPDIISPTFSDGIIMSKTSGEGIKVDVATPTFPWTDLLGNITYRGAGASDPSWMTYQGSLKQFQFSVGDTSYIEFHMPHDYVPGSDIYIHAHWSHNVTTVNGGSVTWGFGCSPAKGHNQAAFPAEITATVVQNASTTQYQHMIAEVQLSSSSPSGSQINNNTLEPDTLILVRAYLSANNITVSSGGVPEPFLHFVDIHYQSTGVGTKAKAPNFYT